MINTKPLVLVLAIGMFSSSAFAGAKIVVNENSHFTIGFLTQPQIRFDQHGALDTDNDGIGDGFSFDPLLRRNRILLYGQVGPKVNFFAETDNPNLGLNGDWTGKMFMQDAWVEFNVHEALQIDAGLLIIPFSHHSVQSATSLLSLDYHSSVIRFPTGFVWRDAGVMVRGELMDKKLEYRLAATQGVDPISNDPTLYYGPDGQEDTDDDLTYPGGVNPSDMPRLSGRLMFNIFESEAGPGVGGFFYDGSYLKEENGKLISPKKVLSIGAGVDFQKDIMAIDTDGDFIVDQIDNYMAIAADVFADLPMGDGTQALNAQVDFYNYNFGEGSLSNGMGLFGEVGYRINRIQPLIAYEMFNYSELEDANYMAIKGGLNWWYLGHAASVKGELGASKVGEGDMSLTGIIQTQLYF